MRVLVVNAGSTSVKRDVVGDGDGPPEAVGHRVVHGGGLREPTVIDDAVVERLRAAAALAPLHTEPALRGIAEARAQLPGVPHVAVFDTAFHATMPDAAATYPVPPEWGIRRYGFHGLSVEWAASRVPVERLVVCHLGGGCSVTAVRDGRSVDTTMGFTPLDGVPMKTRSGSVDPGALLHLLREGMTAEALEDGLERRSGLAAAGADVFVHRVAAAVGAMAVALGGADAVVFTGGIGEHRADLREAIAARVAFLGARVEVVASREELVIARHVETALQA